MECAREGCSCPMTEDRFELDDRSYCCEKCATVCTDGHCRCEPEDCTGR